MPTVTVRNLPHDVHEKLRVRAAESGRSMEAEVRRLIADAVGVTAPADRKAEWDAAIREAQEAFAPFRNPQVSIVDELIAERRLEAWRETVEDHEWLNRHANKPVTPAPKSRPPKSHP